jgi:hypothetical protein
MRLRRLPANDAIEARPGCRLEPAMTKVDSQPALRYQVSGWGLFGGWWPVFLGFIAGGLAGVAIFAQASIANPSETTGIVLMGCVWEALIVAGLWSMARRMVVSLALIDGALSWSARWGQLKSTPATNVVRVYEPRFGNGKPAVVVMRDGTKLHVSIAKGLVEFVLALQQECPWITVELGRSMRLTQRVPG